MKDSLDYWLKIRKEDVYLVCPFFEAFEGMAAIRTPKPAAGDYSFLKLMVSPDFQKDFEELLEYLAGRLSFERLAEAPQA